MKKIFLILSVALILAFSPTAFAHTTVFDGDIGALLHVNPNDDPIAGEASDLHFNLLSDKFDISIADCTCKVTISLLDKKLLEKVILESEEGFGPRVASVPFIFPKKGVYQIVLSGQSRTEQFPDFSLKYDLRIEKEVEGIPIQKNVFTYLLLGGGVLLILLLLFFMQRKIARIKKD